MIITKDLTRKELDEYKGKKIYIYVEPNRGRQLGCVDEGYLESLCGPDNAFFHSCNTQYNNRYIEEFTTDPTELLEKYDLEWTKFKLELNKMKKKEHQKVKEWKDAQS